MGCRESRTTHYGPGRKHDQDLRLTTCKLVFNQRQLKRINRKFEYILAQNRNLGRTVEKQATCLNVVIERLIQRLVCNVGALDSRFASAFLVNLEPLKNYDVGPKRKFKSKYLIRLDLISSPSIYPEFFEPPVRVLEGIEGESLPEAFAKIRIHGQFLEEWTGFISSSGFLRRDKIQEKFIELLAKAAAKPSQPLTPTDVDESRFCGSPGKIVDPITLHHLLNTQSHHRFFFASAGCNEMRFPDPRDFRIAIVEGTPEIRLHVSFLSPAARSISTDDCVEISIILGIGVAGWPLSSDFPHRLPLDHPDVVLAYRSAQMNYYLVPKGPHSSVYCEDRPSVWEIRTYATEMFLQHHYSPNSAIFRVCKILMYLLEVLQARGVKTINRYILKNCLFFELEIQKNICDWAPQQIPCRVLSILDRLLLCLRCQNLPSYFFIGKNLLLQDNIFDEDYASDADILENYLKLLHSDCYVSEGNETETSADLSKDLMENVMLNKWEDLIGSMIPPMSNRSVRLAVVNDFSTTISYTRQQIEYVALLLREILNLKNIQKMNEVAREKNERNVNEEVRNKEDFLYLLKLIFEQAKQVFFVSMAGESETKSKKQIKMNKVDEIIMRYDISTAMVIEDIRTSEHDNYSFSDDIIIVVKIIGILYKSIDSDGKVFGRVLRLYLNQLFKGSHRNCWFLPEWKKRNEISEVTRPLNADKNGKAFRLVKVAFLLFTQRLLKIKAMEVYGNLVLSRRLDPLEGLKDASNKGWIWASTALQILRTITEETSTSIIVGKKLESDEPGLKLIFTPEPHKTVRVNVAMKAENWKIELGETTAEDGVETRDRQATIKSFKQVLGSVMTNENSESSSPSQCSRPLLGRHAPHFLLRNGNPFTVASMESRRQGNHRGLGSVVQALISLQKLTVLQEIAQYLPDKERTRVLGDIKKLSKEIERLTIENHKSNYFMRNGRKKNRFSFKRSTESLVSKKKLAAITNKVKPSVAESPEVYKSRNEFTPTEVQTFSPSKAESTSSEKVEREKESKETLLSTCRILRHHQRPSLFDSKRVNAFSKDGGRVTKGDLSTLFKISTTINTPFYIAVSAPDQTNFTGS